jgi:hypothetical protein
LRVFVADMCSYNYIDVFEHVENEEMKEKMVKE